MNASVADWLTQETADLLDVGSVGLYELFEILASSDFDLDEETKRSVSRQVAADLLDRGVAGLWLLRWPTDVIDGPLPPSVLDEPVSWGWLPNNLYIAMMPTTDQPS
jgi:hypothetical protein